MGMVFAYMGHQYPLTLGKDDFALDILFYNTVLHCYVVVDLKTKKFIPEYAGKMNFYLSLVDEKLKSSRPSESNPKIGSLLYVQNYTRISVPSLMVKRMLSCISPVTMFSSSTRH